MPKTREAAKCSEGTEDSPRQEGSEAEMAGSEHSDRRASGRESQERTPMLKPREAKDGGNDGAKNEVKNEVKNEAKNQVKNEAKDEAKDKTKDKAKDENEGAELQSQPQGSRGPAPPSPPCSSSADREIHWYVAQIVRPQLDQLLDALRITSNLLLYNAPHHPGPHTPRGAPVTLPLSSSNHTVSGVLTRDGAYVTKLQAKISGSRVVSSLALVRPLLVAQIIGAKTAIDAATVLLVQASSLFEASDHVDHAALAAVLRELHAELGAAKSALQLPTDPALVFPQHVARLADFEPDFGRRLAVDVYISQAEVCVDVKDLRRVTERPWCDVDAAGKSYVDRVRDDMLAGRKPQFEDDTSVWARLVRHKVDPADYVARCVTYDGVVVMVQHKAEVLLPDPVLYSAFTKLDTVEYVVGTFMENMEKLM